MYCHCVHDTDAFLRQRSEATVSRTSFSMWHASRKQCTFSFVTRCSNDATIARSSTHEASRSSNIGKLELSPSPVSDITRTPASCNFVRHSFTTFALSFPSMQQMRKLPQKGNLPMRVEGHKHDNRHGFSCNIVAVIVHPISDIYITSKLLSMHPTLRAFIWPSPIL